MLAEPYLLPNDQNFTGRNRETAEIIQTLTTEFTRIVSIYGPPGFGKSEVTKAVGHYLKSKGKTVYRIELEDVYTKDDLISTLLRFISDEPRGNLKPVDFLVRQLSKVKDPVYFILDNADNLLESNVKDGVINLIEEILTNSPRVTILVATRESSEFSKLQALGQRVVRIGPLDHLSSHNLVQKLLPKSCEADCRKIAQFCGNMPFAIRVLCNCLPQHEMPLDQAIDHFVSSSNNFLSRLDNPDELNNSRLGCILNSSYQRLSPQNQKYFLSLFVIPGTFKAEVAAAVWGIPLSDAMWTLKRLHRKALIDSGLQPGSYKVHRMLRLFSKQIIEQETKNGFLNKFRQFFARFIGKQDITEVLVNSKIRFYNYYISLFAKLNERFVSGQSMSAFNDFYDEKLNIISSLIDGCSERSTRDKVFDALIHGVLFLDTSLWSDWASFDKIYDTAINEVKQHGNNTTYTQLVLARTFCEVTWREEEVETLQLFCSIDEIQACRSNEEKGTRSSFLGIHKLVNGQVEDGIAHLENCSSYLSETTDSFLRVLKIIIFQILCLYYESKSNVNRAFECYKKASKECELAVGNRSLLVCPKMTSTHFSSTYEKIAKEQNQPLVLEVYLHIAKAAKVFCHMETTTLFKYDVLQMRKENDANLFTDSKVGSFYLHRSIVGVLAEMTEYDEAIKSIKAMINALHKRTDSGENSTNQKSELDDISKDLRSVDDVKHKEALAKSYSYLAVLQFRTKGYKASLQSQMCALDIRRDLHVLDERHPDIADSYHELAIIHRTLGDFKSALRLQQHALDIRIHLPEISSFKEFSLKRAASYHELGVTQCKMQDFSSAFLSHESALKIRLENLGDQHRDTASSYHELGITQWYMEKYKCALDSHKKALMITLGVFGKNHSVTADSDHEIGKTHFCLEDYLAALRSHLDAYHTRLEVLGEQNADTANSCYEIGATHFEMGWYASALQYHTLALKTRQALNAETQQANVAQSLYQVGRTQCQVGNYEQAVLSLKGALCIKKSLLGEQHNETADVYYEMGKAFFHKEDYTSALEIHQLALDIRHLKLDGKHAMVADSLFHIGLAQWKLKKYQLSRKVHQRALDIRLERFGAKHAETAESYFQLGLVLGDLGLYIEALDSHKQALKIRRELLGNLHTATANSYLETGNAHMKVCEFDSAFRSFEDALQIRAKLVAKEDEEVADLDHDWQVEESLLQDYKSPLQLYQRVLTVTVEYSSSLQSQNKSLRQRLSSLKQQLIKKANFYHEVGNKEHLQKLSDLAAALKVHQRALHLRVTLLGKKHEDTASSYCSVGQVQYKIIDYRSALQSHQRALTKRREMFGDNHPHTADSYNNIGNTQQALGDYTSALQSHQRALTIRREMFGDNHPHTATSYDNIGNTQQALGDYTLALQSHQRALTIRREKFGDDHPRTAASYNNIGNTQQALGDYTLALQSHQRALTIRREKFGDDHPHTAASYNNIGNTQQALGDYTLALQSHQRALTIRREKFGDDHPRTAASYNNIGNIQEALGDYTLALQSHQRARTIRREMFGDNHPDTAGSYNNIGNTQQALGDYTAALQLQQRALKIKREIFGDNHPDTATSYNNIGNTQQALGDYISALQSHQQALKIRREILGDNHPHTARSYDNIRAAQHALGDYTSSL